MTEGNPGQHTAQEHPGPSFHIISLKDGYLQVFCYQLDGIQGRSVRQGFRYPGRITLFAFPQPTVIYYYLNFSLIFMQDSGIKLLARSDDNLYARLIYMARIRIQLRLISGLFQKPNLLRIK
jgi:hypothetical protein